MRAGLALGHEIRPPHPRQLAHPFYLMSTNRFLTCRDLQVQGYEVIDDMFSQPGKKAAGAVVDAPAGAVDFELSLGDEVAFIVDR